jgi:hypothetical protein
VILLRKSSMVFLVVFLSSIDQKSQQITIAFLFLFGFFGLQMIAQPFVEAHLNWQESIALLNHVVAFFIGLLYVTGLHHFSFLFWVCSCTYMMVCVIAEATGGESPNEFLGLALILFVAATGLWLLKYTIREIRQSLAMVRVFFTKQYLAELLAWIFSAQILDNDPLSAAELVCMHTIFHPHQRVCYLKLFCFQ